MEAQVPIHFLPNTHHTPSTSKQASHEAQHKGVQRETGI